MSTPHTPSDETLLAALRDGEDLALERIVARWEKPLFAFAWRYLHDRADAQDLATETFVRLYHHRERIHPDAKLSAWLFTTLGNLCRNQHRWRRRHPTVSLDATPNEHEADDLAPRPISAALPPDRALESDERLRALAAALDRLPHDMKTALLLHHFERLSYREIAAVVGCSERGVETRLYRARRLLRADLATALDPVMYPT
ncbi:sigma-70 family RNA polymerase sigma factor [Opitutales bacterium ASA1]|uniref:RNA polymerase sigma factor n=1 Tax=Congregicoccus parvus TaxID=3081749 RepID=UPI002B2F2FA3|nr:sigma-70 family RNA polymerase sigma factor [Opitutales bacterium ASA1]